MHPIEIMLPENVVAPTDSKLLVMFLDCLLSSASQEQQIEISGGMVTSGNPKLREVLTMILRAKRFDELLQQLTPVLFPSTGSRGLLHFTANGVTHSFEIFEHKPLPNLKWKIARGD